ncbi:MAG: HAD family hydrolase, partial [Limnohabitans sp.]
MSNSRPRQYDLIAFDWDGTLFDSTAIITRCIQLARLELCEHLEYTVKQADVVLVGPVVISIAFTQQGVPVFGHVGRRMRQRGHERHADHVRSLFAGRYRAPHILHRQLDA